MMKRGQRGFTLVELLVVMAIIAILAAIVVPNVVKYIGRSRATKALGDITSIELALTKLVADADRSNLNHLFNADAVGVLLGVQGMMTTQQFEAAQLLYTRTLYALLREGRAALTDTDDVLANTFGAGFVNFGSVLNAPVIKKLGTSYLEDIGFDPWGNMYQIWPGPWNNNNGPNVFRIYTIDTSSSLPGTKAGGRQDVLTVLDVEDPETGLMDPFGYAAPRDKIAFIWSYGANLVSGQAIYQNVGYEGPTYLADQEQDFWGGGDDVNNWDKGQSYMRFYN